MTELELLKEIADSLRDIKELLAKQQTAAPAKTYTGASSGGASSGPDLRNIPPVQPSKLVDDPDSVVIPWGKNSGRTLGSLSENSLRFYCEEPPPRLDSSGKPYPSRPADVDLRNAARQLWHRQKGSLTGKEPERHAPPPRSDPPAGAGASSNLDEDVPFASRYYDHG